MKTKSSHSAEIAAGAKHPFVGYGAVKMTGGFPERQARVVDVTVDGVVVMSEFSWAFGEDTGQIALTRMWDCVDFDGKSGWKLFLTVGAMRSWLGHGEGRDLMRAQGRMLDLAVARDGDEEVSS